MGVNRLFVLLFKNATYRTVHTKYYLPNVEIKDDNILIDGQSVFDETVKNNLRTYDYISKLATGQGHDYMTSCLLDYSYFNKYVKIIAKDLCKQQALDADLKEQIQYSTLILQEI